MKKITSIDELKETILLLEIKQAGEWLILKEQFHTTYISLKPSNIIKNKFKEMTSGPDFKKNVVNGAIGFATGIIAKKLFLGNTNNPLTKLLGIAIEMGVASVTAQNADGIKSIGSSILKKLLPGRSEKV